MQRSWLVATGKLLWRTCGLALVFAACAGVANAAPPPPAAPEIDPGSLLTGLTLCVGGVLMVVDRVRRK